MERRIDYIIVGAGSAGCVVASRLSEQPDVSVLLIEAGGPDKRKEIHIPAGWPKLLKSEVDWAYETEPQPHLHDRRLYWPRGKVLGGSSSINALIYTRGNRRDFDRWHDAGNPGWDFSSVEADFRKSALGTSDAAPGHVLSRAFVDACEDAGIPRTSDFNGAQQEGAAFFRVTVADGKRSSAASAYLAPARSRPNLTVRTNTLVSRVIVERGRAIGVEIARASGGDVVHAARDVILCGGAINSPQLLLLSGIGPADQLQRAGVSVVHDLPGVGRSLRDHLLAGIVHESTQPVSMNDAGTIGDIARYLLRRQGRLRSNLAEAGAFVRLTRDADRPDMELIFAPVFYMNHGFANPKGHGYSIGAVLQHPRSVGSIALRTSNPADAPIIQPNYLTDDADLQTLLAGVKLARHVAAGRAFAPYRGRELWPGGDATTDDQLVERIRAQAETLYHPMGTCRMGRDADAVVDEQLRVRGLHGLRVVDASIFPDSITGHPNAVVVMCAEKAAALIAAPQQV